jgi:simple sugar transport system permease protein
MLNFVAVGLVGYLVQGPLMESAGTYPQTDALGAAMRLPRFDPSLRLHVGILIALLAAGLSSILLFRTVLGYEMRAVGANPEAAALAGIPIQRCVLITLLLSGGLAGLAGGIEVSAVTYRVYEKFSPGYGFTAIAVALLGRLHPAGVIAAALLFGALEAGSNSMQRVAGVSSVLVSVLQATVIFSLLAFEGGTLLRWRTAPKD